MLAHNLKIQRGVAPSKMEKTKDGRINVYYKTPDGKDACDVYDTVLLAIGRKAVTEDLNLGNIGIKPHPNGKIDVDEFEQTSVKGVYAIGDVIFGKPELTPVAIKTGILLAKRLGHTSDRQMDYNLIPTTVFTQLEYGFVGYAEEDAIKKFTKEKITVYHTSFQPLEWSMYEGHEKDVCYAKVIVNNENDKVLGIHITSPNAGEVVQGLAVAMNCGLTKEQLDMTVGIHPTIAEEIVGLLETKDSNPDAKKKGC
jgi:thioredoxin reductase (NADPH)